MTGSDSGPVPGFVPLVEGVPEGLSVWSGASVECGLDFSAPIDVMVILGEDEDWDAIDTTTIEALPRDVDDLLRGVLGFVRDEVGRNPESFGLDPRSATAYAGEPPTGLGLDLPEITFHGDGTWFVRFAVADAFPAARELGLGVTCAGSTPLRVETLDDGEGIP